MVMLPENWTKDGAERHPPFIAPPSFVLHVEEGFWIEGVSKILKS
jgi:hypothetical protein